MENGVIHHIEGSMNGPLGDYYTRGRMRGMAVLRSHGPSVWPDYRTINGTLRMPCMHGGGLVASLLKDQYLGFNVESTRSFKEWRLLKKLREFELPVPEAVAARAVKGFGFYRADLITEKIEDSVTLADRLAEGEISAELWQRLGGCINRFHAHDVYHADLNARNILLTGNDDIYLIDFDNSYIRSGSASWKMANLARLKRSLMKFKNNKLKDAQAGFHFEESDWQALLEGYKK